jgi:AcrR family transcriptional regulator
LADSHGPRRLRTRTAILAAAQRLFATRTYETVSVEDITEAAQIAKGSFYNHFADKHQLATEIGSLLQSHVAELVARDGANHDDPAVRCVRGTMIVLRFALEHPESAKALTRLSKDHFSVSDPLNNQAMDIIKDGIEDGTFTEVGREDAFVVVVGISQMLVEQAAEKAWKEDLPVIAQKCCTGMLRALGVKLPKARRVSEFAAEDLLREL